MTTKVVLTYELDPQLWSEVDELTDAEVLELVAEDWIAVIEGAEASVERDQPTEAPR